MLFLLEILVADMSLYTFDATLSIDLNPSDGQSVTFLFASGLNITALQLNCHASHVVLQIYAYERENMLVLRLPLFRSSIVLYHAVVKKKSFAIEIVQCGSGPLVNGFYATFRIPYHDPTFQLISPISKAERTKMFRTCQSVQSTFRKAPDYSDKYKTGASHFTSLES